MTALAPQGPLRQADAAVLLRHSLLPVFVSDLRHFLDMPDDAPAPARRMAEHLARIVEAGMTSPSVNLR